MRYVIFEIYQNALIANSYSADPLGINPTATKVSGWPRPSYQIIKMGMYGIELTNVYMYYERSELLVKVE